MNEIIDEVNENQGTCPVKELQSILDASPCKLMHLEVCRFQNPASSDECN